MKSDSSRNLCERVFRSTRFLKTHSGPHKQTVNFISEWLVLERGPLPVQFQINMNGHLCSADFRRKTELSKRSSLSGKSLDQKMSSNPDSRTRLKRCFETHRVDNMTDSLNYCTLWYRIEFYGNFKTTQSESISTTGRILSHMGLIGPRQWWIQRGGEPQIPIPMQLVKQKVENMFFTFV